MNEPVVAGPLRQSVPLPDPAPRDTLTVYVPSPSNWTSDPTGTISPGVPIFVTQYGGMFCGCVAWPSGTATNDSAARWSSFGSPDDWSR